MFISFSQSHSYQQFVKFWFCLKIFYGLKKIACNIELLGAQINHKMKKISEKCVHIGCIEDRSGPPDILQFIYGFWSAISLKKLLKPFFKL